MRLRTFTLTAVLAILQFVPAARARSFDGTFRGTLVCEKMPATADMLVAPLDINIRGSDVQFARPFSTWTAPVWLEVSWEAELSTLRVSCI